MYKWTTLATCGFFFVNQLGCEDLKKRTSFKTKSSNINGSHQKPKIDTDKVSTPNPSERTQAVVKKHSLIFNLLKTEVSKAVAQDKIHLVDNTGKPLTVDEFASAPEQNFVIVGNTAVRTTFDANSNAIKTERFKVRLADGREVVNSLAPAERTSQFVLANDTDTQQTLLTHVNDLVAPNVSGQQTADEIDDEKALFLTLGIVFAVVAVLGTFIFQTPFILVLGGIAAGVMFIIYSYRAKLVYPFHIVSVSKNLKPVITVTQSKNAEQYAVRINETATCEGVYTFQYTMPIIQTDTALIPGKQYYACVEARHASGKVIGRFADNSPYPFTVVGP